MNVETRFSVGFAAIGIVLGSLILHHTTELAGGFLLLILTCLVLYYWTGLVRPGLLESSVVSAALMSPHVFYYVLAMDSWLAACAVLQLWVFFSLTNSRWDRQNQAINYLEVRSKRLAHSLKVQTEEASEALEKAKAANIAKSKFLAAASHDLRQPLHAMGLLLHSLEDRVEDKSTLATLQQLELAHESMEKLFGALLDVSKLDAGAVDIHLQDFSLVELLNELHDEFKPSSQAKGLLLELQAEDVIVRSDPILLIRILRNLINNAIVHTESGSVCISTVVKPQAVDVVVTDTGPGIPAAEHSRIFSEFHQLRNPERNLAKGLGLGLAIVKRLCNLLGHDVGLASTPGRGTVFTLTVARRTRGSVTSIRYRPDAPAIAGNLAGVGVLVIDDDRAILRAMNELLQRWGMEVEVASGAEEAMAILTTGFKPDILLCDYRLGGSMTGVDLLQVLSRKIGNRVPGLLVSGDTAPQRIKEAHASGYPLLHKPVHPAKLRNALTRQLVRFGKGNPSPPVQADSA